MTFDIDANGIVNVSARDKGTGKEQQSTCRHLTAVKLRSSNVARFCDVKSCNLLVGCVRVLEFVCAGVVRASDDNCRSNAERVAR